MKRFITSFLILGVGLSTILYSCKEEQKQDCSTVGCTEEFRTISVTITANDGTAVVLDDYYTFIDSRNRFVANSGNNDPSVYPVATDADMDLIDEGGTVVIFVGVINDENVVEHQMEIGKDCCHINLIAGETTIVVD